MADKLNTAIQVVAPSTSRALVAASRGEMSSMDVVPSTLCQSEQSVAVFGLSVKYPRVNLAQPTFDRPFVVALPREPTEEERKATREEEKETLEALPLEQKRELFGMVGYAPLPEFYNRNKSQCYEACYEAHKIDKGGGKFRSGRKHFPDCAQGMALAAQKRLKR